jgi:hypothetical protein
VDATATSPTTDTATANHCYQYELIVTDQLGNVTTTPLGGVIKVN